MGKERVIVTFWDAHTKDAPHASDRWATSDRGWLVGAVARENMATSEIVTVHGCLGHYLDYGESHRRYDDHDPNATADRPCRCSTCEPGHVHAVLCVQRTADGHAWPLSGHCPARYCLTVGDAQRWLEEQSGVASPVLINPPAELARRARLGDMWATR